MPPLEIPRRFPINTIQWHREHMSGLDEHLDNPQVHIVLGWHMTAIAYLQYGELKGMNSPAAEIRSNGQVFPYPIEDELKLREHKEGDPPLFDYVLKGEL